MGYVFLACCCGGDYVWYQYNTLGRETSVQEWFVCQNYIAMHIPVLPSSSAETPALYESYAGDVELPEPPWGVNIGVFYLSEGDSKRMYCNITGYQSMGYADSFEKNFFCVVGVITDEETGEPLPETDPECYIGMINCTDEVLEWRMQRSPASTPILAVVEDWQISPTFGQIVPDQFWGNKAPSPDGFVYPLPIGDTFPTLFTEGKWESLGFEVSGGISIFNGHGAEQKVAIGKSDWGVSAGPNTMAFQTFGTARMAQPVTELITDPFPQTIFHDDVWGPADDPDTFGFDSIIAYRDGVETVIAGSTIAQDWWAIEYPGMNGILYAPTGSHPTSYWVDNIPTWVASANAADAIYRIALIPPRTWPYCFGVKYPKAHIIGITEISGDMPVLSNEYTISVDEEVTISICEIGEPGDPLTQPIPLSEVTSAETVFYATDSNNRAVNNDVTVAYRAILQPISLKTVVLYGDINEQVQWGVIFTHCQRTINAWVDTETFEFDESYEEVTSEEVRLEVRINSESASRNWVIYRDDEAARAWDMIAAPLIVAEQNSGYPTARHFLWLERYYTEEPTAEDPGTWADNILFINSVGETSPTEVWRTFEASDVGPVPHIRHCADNLFCLFNFRQVWPVDKGGDGEVWWNWVCSYETEEIEVSPGVFQPRPKYLEPIRPQPGIQWSGWGGGPFIDSFKYNEKNRIAKTW